MQNLEAIIHAVANACTFETSYQRSEHQSQDLIEMMLICEDRAEIKGHYI